MALATPLKQIDHKTELAVCKTLASKRKREKAPQLEEYSVVRISHASMPPPRGTWLHLELGGLVNRIVLRACGLNVQVSLLADTHTY